MKTVTKVLPAIRVDKRTGKKMWFNAVYIAYLALLDARNDGTKTVLFPNGDTISAETIETLRQVMMRPKCLSRGNTRMSSSLTTGLFNMPEAISLFPQDAYWPVYSRTTRDLCEVICI